MKFKSVLFCAALIGTTALITATVVSQDKPDGEGAGDWHNPMTEPGEHHQKLNAFVGKWRDELKFWQDPTSEPMEMTGTSEYKWILNGHYIQGNFKGEFMGEPFEGFEIMGYDNMREEYFTVWIDSAGTGVGISRGNMKDGKLVMSGTMDDPMSGMKDIKTRSIGTSIDENTHGFEMYVIDPQGNEMKSMEIVSKRVK